MTLSRRSLLSAAALAGLSAGVFTAADAWPVKPAAKTPVTERWGCHELTFTGPDTGNPFIDVDIAADFTNGRSVMRVGGFYDGGGVYRIRFSPPDIGTWRWKTVSNAPALNDQTGAFDAVPPSRDNHGPVRVAHGYHFAYADGTPYAPIGTTCYSWAQQSDARCDQTLATLAASPFNKIRMCVFPNVAAEAIYPFEKLGTGDKDWDWTRFNPAYFRRFEDRVARLLAIGVEADIIIYQPYDAKRGFSDMTRAQDERYLRYLIARLSAYRNVWWSFANEFDLIKTKTTDDIDHLFRLIQSEDAHDRLRSIHNLKILYDNRKPWITHSSVQNGSAVLDDRTAETYRSVWEKPVVFDEVCYEGDIAARWGNLSGEQLLMRFWHGLIGGTYVGHSETFTADKSGPDHSWLGQGGTLLGQSWRRIAFLKQIMAEGPGSGIDPIDKWWERHLGGQEGQYYLRYFGEETPTQWPLSLPKNGLTGGEKFRADIIDTWNMTVTPVDGAFTLAKKDAYDFNDPARPVITLPGKPWMAVRLVRVAA
ncbi:hypothetical protein AEAC466_09715 [Asticcacaulis sp. AC466]|uniref:DUF5605 domain-containing protein n=1 Tax=Asticcacaulis sp. AC466 TaxID=1282362 RepID=UPI0003C3B68B|nr:DUF5605 domain-containing protein [Asticcacaulis sp. AC466]ESQ84012.1 hypothetical protein AEAC466_09715 [Asticcacaulis sp. AC466]